MKSSSSPRALRIVFLASLGLGLFVGQALAFQDQETYLAVAPNQLPGVHPLQCTPSLCEFSVACANGTGACCGSSEGSTDIALIDNAQHWDTCYGGDGSLAHPATVSLDTVNPARVDAYFARKADLVSKVEQQLFSASLGLNCPGAVGCDAQRTTIARLNWCAADTQVVGYDCDMANWTRSLSSTRSVTSASDPTQTDVVACTPGSTGERRADGLMAAVQLPKCMYYDPTQVGGSTLNSGLWDMGDPCDPSAAQDTCQIITGLPSNPVVGVSGVQWLHELDRAQLAMMVDAATQAQHANLASGACGNHINEQGCQPLDPAYYQTARLAVDMDRNWRATQPSDIVLVVDTSGSMSACDGGYPCAPDETRFSQAISDAKNFVNAIPRDRVDGNHRVAVVSFASAAFPEQPFVELTGSGDLAEPLCWPGESTGGCRGTVAPSGMTSIGSGVQQALGLLNARVGADKDRPSSIVIITDGMQNTPTCIADDAVTLSSYCVEPSPDATVPYRKSTVLTADANNAQVRVPVCSISPVSSQSVDWQILNDLSEGRVHAPGTPVELMDQFLACLGESVDRANSMDPGFALARGAVSFKPETYDSCGDLTLQFNLNYSRTVSAANDMRLLVEAPSGDLLQPSSLIQGDRHQIVEKTDPAFGSYRMQVARAQHRIVNGFASDAVLPADHAKAVQMVRRQIHRLCPPQGCADTLFIEDGRATATGPSVYADAIAAEAGKTLHFVRPFLAGSSATDIATALGFQWDLIVFAHQASSSVAGYDDELVAKLCNTMTPAIITDTRFPTAVTGSDIYRIGSCAGVVPAPGELNFTQIDDPDGQARLINGSIRLRNPGYAGTFSYASAPYPWDAFADAVDDVLHLPSGYSDVYRHMMAPVVEVASPNSGDVVVYDDEFVLTSRSGAVIATSLDHAPTVGGDYHSREEQIGTFDTVFDGVVHVQGEGKLLEDGLFAKLYVPPAFVPAGGYDSADVRVEVTYPTMDLPDVLAELGCPSAVDPSGDSVPGGTSLSPYDIPTATTPSPIALGAASPFEFQAVLPGLGDTIGDYKVRYIAKFQLTDNTGHSCTARREAVQTLSRGLPQGSAPLVVGSSSCTSVTGGPIPDLEVEDINVTMCTPGLASVMPNVSYSGSGSVTGRIVYHDGSSIDSSLVLRADEPMYLPPGNTVVQWTVDDGGARQIITQNVAVSLLADTSTGCCMPGETVVSGWNLWDVFVLPLPQRYCVLGKGANDVITTGPLADSVFGGTGNDTLTNLGAGGLTAGGAGGDMITGFSGGGDVYGGDGNDTIVEVGPGNIHGGAGNDQIIGAIGNHDVIPGPGVDFVQAGFGDDTIYLYDLCEVGLGEVLDGSLGTDTLITPVPLSTLAARGVLVLGIENVQVVGTSLARFSECVP